LILQDEQEKIGRKKSIKKRKKKKTMSSIGSESTTPLQGDHIPLPNPSSSITAFCLDYEN